MKRVFLASILFAFGVTAALASGQLWSVWEGTGDTQLADLLAKGYQIKTSYSRDEHVYLVVQGPKDAYRCRVEADMTALKISSNVLYCDKVVRAHQVTIPDL